MFIYDFIKNRYAVSKINKKWRQENAHNFTDLGVISHKAFHYSKIEIGTGTYGEINVKQFEPAEYKIKIGNYCSIGPDVIFMLDGEHHTDKITTYPFKARFYNKTEGVSKGPIVVDDDVWIGAGVTVLSNVHIGQGAVIAAGAVVTKDVEPYSIAGGVPAKIIKKRFPDSLINELLKVDYSRLTKEMIDEHIDDLYSTLESADQLEWLPKK